MGQGKNVDKNKFIVMYTNADCLTNKMHELHLFLSSLDVKPTAIVVTEVNAKVSSCPMQDFEFKIEGYVMHSLNIGLTKSRGIIIYIDKNVDSNVLDITCAFSEFLCVTIRDKYNNYITVCAIYRSPNSNSNNDAELFKLLSIVSASSVGKLIILGDFNYCNINWNNCSIYGSVSGNTPGHKFLSAVNKNFLTQHVLFPTRVRGSQMPHTLDLVLTLEDFVDKITDFSPLGKSDHCILYIQCDLNCVFKDSTNSVKYNYNKGNYDDMSIYITNALVTSTSLADLDVDSEWRNLKSIVAEGVNSFVPCYSNNSWMQKRSWKYPIKSSTRRLIKDKHRLWKRYLNTRDPETLNEYKTIRNLVR